MHDDDDDEISVCVQTVYSIQQYQPTKQQATHKQPYTHTTHTYKHHQPANTYKEKTDPIEANFSNNAIYFNALFVLIVSNVLYSLHLHPHHLPLPYMLYYTIKAPPPPLLPPISYKNPYLLCN
ncbi:conserved hypothetical protein [Trichinella spiralis]|uniref:hypothetical protein n=1 Tax=Trichinella spiralis TaxID=6334 RepID=UPI0001EFE158|nr:conserved hypothetical protein [Trichinella spiralis]